MWYTLPIVSAEVEFKEIEGRYLYNSFSILREIKVHWVPGEYGHKAEIKKIDGRTPPGVELAA